VPPCGPGAVHPAIPHATNCMHGQKVRHIQFIHSLSTHLLAPTAPLLAIFPAAIARTAHALFAAAAACSITPTRTSTTTLVSKRHG
jgi:hypothetical protein